MNSATLKLSELRQQTRKARRQLSVKQKNLADKDICLHVQHLLLETKPATIGTYLPFDGEPDLHQLVEWIRQQNIEIALPKIDSEIAGIMQFHSWPVDAHLQRNRFGIDETQKSTSLGANIDLLLTPLVAFSTDGTRIGMGSGYYDRWLSTQSPRPVIVGIAYELQRYETLQKQSWDIPMDMVITEKGRFSCAEDRQ